MLLGELGRSIVNRRVSGFLRGEWANGIASCDPLAELPLKKFDGPIVLELNRNWLAREDNRFLIGVETETDGSFSRCMASARGGLRSF